MDSGIRWTGQSTSLCGVHSEGKLKRKSEIAKGYIDLTHMRLVVNTSISVPTFAMPINRHVRLMTGEISKKSEEK